LILLTDRATVNGMNPLEIDTQIGPGGVLTLSQLPFANGQRVHVRIEPHSEDDNGQPRVLGLHAGMISIADDFDDQLPDEFWLGADAGDEAAS
jgi:hypothetical protein